MDALVQVLEKFVVLAERAVVALEGIREDLQYEWCCDCCEEEEPEPPKEEQS